MPLFIQKQRSKGSFPSVYGGWKIVFTFRLLLWKQAISYKPGLPLSFIDEEPLIRSPFFCKFEISCPPKDIKIRWINAHCHFDRPYSPVSLHICSRRENYQILSLIMMKERGVGWVSEDRQPVRAGWEGNRPGLMNAIALQGEPWWQLIPPLQFEVLLRAWLYFSDLPTRIPRDLSV